MSTPIKRFDVDPAAAAAAWLRQFDQALRDNDPAAALGLFDDDCHWRDLLAFGWDLSSVSGKHAMQSKLAQSLARVKPTDFALAAGRTPPRRVVRAGIQTIEAFIEFKTAQGPAEGVLRLLEPANGAPVATPRGWILMTALVAIAGHEEAVGEHRPGMAESLQPTQRRQFGAENWLDRRNRARAFADREPAVVVIGAGQAGLTIAARLGRLGIDTLVVDRQKRLGDNWRNRYHSLTLHNEVFVNDLPYLPFPPSWPVYIPKDMLANWFEFYADALELNCWMSTELVNGRYDPIERRWSIALRGAGAGRRVVHPRHLVFATGVSGIPITPALPGLDAFEGNVMHSGQFKGGAHWRGRSALVLGTGTSGHDVAQELHALGAKVTLIQRSPTYVVSLKEAQRVYLIYRDGMPVADCDSLLTANPLPVLKRAYQLATEESNRADKPLLDALQAKGFRLDRSEGHLGFQWMYLQRGGGYYFDVGCSSLIVDGEIDLLQFDAIDRFVADGVRLKDGRTRPADLLVVATGYHNQQEQVRMTLGDEVADRIGPVWGFGEDGELRNMWRPTMQPGLWFTGGSLAQCRIYSKYLAMQIKAREIGAAQ